MAKKFASFAVVVALAVLVGACGISKSSLTGPSDQPPPDQSKYESLPATHQFVDGNGQTVKAWVTFNDVSPLRGTEVAKQVCPANVAGKWCFSYPAPARIWIENPDLGPEVNNGLGFRVWFSDDGVSPRGDSPSVGGGSIGTTINKMEWLLGGNGGFYPVSFAIAPKFLIFDGEYWYSAPKQGGIKWTSVRATFELDYH